MSYKVAIFKHVPLGATDEEQQESLQRAREAALEVQRFYRKYWPDFEARGYIEISDRTPATPWHGGTWNLTEMQSQKPDDGFEPTHWHIWGGREPNTCGRAPRPGNVGITYELCGWETMIHEIGHDLGLAHSGAYKSDGSVGPYDDSSNVMGGKPRDERFSAPHQDEKNLLPSKVEVASSQQVWLCPLDSPAYTCFEDETHAAVIKAEGYPPVYASVVDDRILFQEFRPSKATALQKSLGVGQEAELLNGVTVRHTKQDASPVHKLSIYYNVMDGVVDRISPEVPLPPAPVGTEITGDYQGFWTDPRYPGQGLVVTLVREKVLVFWYTFCENVHDRRFFFCVFPAGSPSNATLWTTENGIERDIGSAQLYFDSAGTGKFLVNSEELGGRLGMEIQLLQATDDPMNGAWVSALYDQEGFTIHFFEDTCVAHWYKNKKAPPYGSPDWVATDDNRTQEWLLLTGTLNEQGQYDMTIREVLEGRFMESVPVMEPEVGSATIELGEDSITLAYDMQGDSEVLSLVRV